MMNARAKLAKAIKGLQLEINRIAIGGKAVVPLAQLNRINRALEVYISELDEDRKTFSNFHLGKHIVDSWPFDFVIGGEIIEAERAFLNCTKQT